MLAPENVIFFDKKWTELGTKLQREKEISNITGIKRQVLGGLDCMEVPVNDKMRWASRRQTTRLEDQAYCLLGIFGINMPLLYGEGSRAFIRLQEEILRRGNDDPSLFIWRAKSAWKGPSKSVYHGLLAESPADFQEYRHLRLTSSPSSISSRGVQLRVRLKPFRRGVYQGVLACSEFKEGKKTGDVAIRLLHIPKDSNDARKAAISEDDIFVRINIDALDVIDPAEVQDKAEYLIQISNVTNAPGLTHKPGSSLPVSIERSSLLRFDVRQVFGLRYETNSPADTLYVKPATGKLVGYCLDSKTKGIPKPCVLTVVGLNWTGSPWCAVSHHNDAGEARKVYEKFDVGSTARPAVHESHDGYHVRGSVRLRHRNNRIRVWLLLEVIS